jgi:hypothetical protein
MITEHGYEIDDFISLPPTGKTLAQAEKFGLDLSCIAIAHKPVT